jgi:hypothetical protein
LARLGWFRHPALQPPRAGVYVRSSAGNVTRDSDYTFAGKAAQIIVMKEAA